MLSIFSDSIREANQLLERLVRLVPFPEYWPKEIWFETSYPHMDETRRIISHNWTLVLKHQQEASDIILQRFERTTREVQGLMDGVSQHVQLHLPNLLTNAWETAVQCTVRHRGAKEQTAQ